MGFLEGKVAVVTGAGGGMGKATARVLAREGARIVACDISGTQEQTVAELGAEGLFGQAVLGRILPGDDPLLQRGDDGGGQAGERR